MPKCAKCSKSLPNFPDSAIYADVEVICSECEQDRVVPETNVKPTAFRKEREIPNRSKKCAFCGKIKDGRKHFRWWYTGLNTLCLSAYCIDCKRIYDMGRRIRRTAEERLRRQLAA